MRLVPLRLVPQPCRSGIDRPMPRFTMDTGSGVTAMAKPSATVAGERPRGRQRGRIAAPAQRQRRASESTPRGPGPGSGVPLNVSAAARPRRSIAARRGAAGRRWPAAATA